MSLHLSRRRDIALGAALFCALPASLGGCVSASAVRLGAEVFPGRPLGHPILVFEPDEPPERGYDRIGRVVGEGSDFMSFADIVEAMKGEARRLGGDAILLLGGSLVLESGGECESISVDRTVQAAVLHWG